MKAKERILIVDDEEGPRRTLALILGKTGYETDTAGTGHEALEKAQAGFYSLALVDVKLPDMEGVDLIAPFKEKYPDMVVVMVTGFASKETAIHALNEGASAYITKPVNMDELLAIIREALEKQHLTWEKRQAEEALRKSEKRFQQVAEHAQEWIWEVDASGLYTYASPVVEKVLGFELDEIVGKKNFYDFFHPEDREELKTAAFEVFAQKQSFKGFENRNIRKDGVLVWLSTCGVPLLDGAGDLLGYRGADTDITERVQAEQELRQRNQDLALINTMNAAINQGADLRAVLQLLSDETQRIFESFGVTVYLLDEEQRHLVMQNLNIPQELVEKVEKLLGARIPPVQIPLKPGGVTAQLMKTAAPRLMNDPHEIQAWMQEFGETPFLPDGLRPLVRRIIPRLYKLLRIRSVIIVPLVSDDQIIGLIDISSREAFNQSDKQRLATIANQMSIAIQRLRVKQAFEQLSQHQELILNYAGEGIYGLDSQDRHTFVNPAAARMLGYDVEELIGQKSHVLIHHTKADGSPYPDEECPVYLAYQDGLVHRGSEEIYWRKDGSSFPVEYVSTPINDQSGALVGAVVTFTDITKRVQAEKVQAAIYKISQAVVYTQNIDEFYQAIHDILGTIIPMENFYISSYDPASDQVSFPYYVDQFDQPPRPAKPGRGLTEYVMRTGQSLLASPEVFEQLIRQGEVELVGTAPVDWLGVPLIVDERVIGVLVTQSYTGDVRLSQDEKKLMSFVATQVAVAIERKRGEAQIQESEEKYRTLFVKIPNGVYRSTPEGRLLSANPAMVNMFGYSSEEELLQIDVNDLYIEPSERNANIQQHDFSNEVRHVELRLKRKDGREIIGLDNARAVRDEDGKVLYFDGTLSDITERKQAQEKIQKNVSLNQALAEISQEIAVAGLDLQAVLEVIIHRASELIGDACAIFLVSKDGEWLDLSALHHPNPEVIDLMRDALTAERQKIGNGFVGRVAETGQPVLIPEMSQDQILSIMKAEKFATLDGLGLHSLLIVPLFAQGQVVGTLGVARFKPGQPYTTDDQTYLRNIADRAAMGIVNTELFEQAERRLEGLQALRKIDQAIAGSFDIQVTLNIFLDQVITQLRVDAANVLHLEPHLQTFNFVTGRGFRTSFLQYTNLKLGEGHAGLAALERRIIHVPELNQVDTGLLRSPHLRAEKFISYFAIPLVAKGKVKGVLELFHRSRLDPDQEWFDFLKTLAGQAAITIENITLYDDLQKANVDLVMAYDSTLEGWARALEMRDMETEGHSKRVVDLTMQLARKRGISGEELLHIRRGALLHDIGKMGVPDSILQKSGPLTNEEWEIMKKHPVYAYEWLSPINFLRPGLDIPYCHHERWDGTGYPKGLKDEQIPLAARIFAIVDVWDALFSDRPYRKAWSKEKVLEHIKEQAGKHFDPSVVDTFLELIDSE